MDSSKLPKIKSSWETIKFGTHYKVECVRDGKTVWTEDTDNLIVYQGLEYILGSAVGDTEKKELFCGLCSVYAVDSEDTMEHHEFEEFSGTSSAKRPKAEFDNTGLVGDYWTYTATNIQFMIFEDAYLHGIFLTDNDNKGEDKGMLFGVAPFSDNKHVVVGDSLIVTIMISAEG